VSALCGQQKSYIWSIFNGSLPTAHIRILVVSDLHTAKPPAGWTRRFGSAAGWVE